MIAPQPDGLLYYTGISEIGPSFVTRRYVLPTLVQSAAPASSRRTIYNAQIRINSPAVNSYIHAGIGQLDYVVYGQISPMPVHDVLGFRRLAWKTQQTTWTAAEAWGGLVANWQDISDSLQSVRNIIAAIRNKQRVQLSGETQTLIKRAARNALPDDLEAWARRLAEDVGNLTD